MSVSIIFIMCAGISLKKLEFCVPIPGSAVTHSLDEWMNEYSAAGDRLAE